MGMDIKKLLIISIFLLSGCHAITLSNPISIDTPYSVKSIEDKLTSIKNDNIDKTDKANKTLDTTEKKGQEIVSSNPSNNTLKDLETMWENSSNLIKGYIKDLKDDGTYIQNQIKAINDYKVATDKVIDNDSKEIKKISDDSLLKDKQLEIDKTDIINLKVEVKKQISNGWRNIFVLITIIIILIGVIIGYLFRNKLIWLWSKIKAKL